MPRLAILPVLFAIACSGSGADHASANGVELNAKSQAGNSCNVPEFSSYNSDTATRSGAGSVLFDGNPASLVELTCETRRNTQGAVIGYAVAFGDKTTEPGMETLVKLADYHGDGVYSSAYTEIYKDNGAGLNLRLDNFATLTVSQNGKHGILDSDDGTLHWEYSCDAADDTSTTPKSALADPAPGTAYVAFSGQKVNTFEGVACEYNFMSGQLSISGPDNSDIDKNFRFSLYVDKSNPGTQSAESSTA